MTLADGFLTTGAQEISEAKVIQLLTHLASIALSAEVKPHDRAVAARDGFAFSLMWSTGLRGINARSTQLSEWALQGQQLGSVTAYLHADLTSGSFHHPGALEVQPRKTKTASQNQRRICVRPAANSILDTWFWLTSNYVMAAIAKQPLHSWLVRTTQEPEAAKQLRFKTHYPAHERGPQFYEAALSKSGIDSRLKSHLRSIGAFNGESMHSFRRGMAQHSAAASESDQQIMERMLLDTPAVLKNYYLPIGRHDNGMKRMRTSASHATPAPP